MTNEIPTAVLSSAKVAPAPGSSSASFAKGEELDQAKTLDLALPKLGLDSNSTLDERVEGNSFLAKVKRSFVFRHPLIIVVPILLFGLLCGLGVWGVQAAAKSRANSKRGDAAALALDAATGFELQLKETFTPAVTLTLMIKAQPSWTYWEENWRPVVDELMAYAAPGSIYNIQAQPLGQVRIIHPLRFSDRSQYGKDLLVEKGRREDALRLIAKHEWGMTVSYLTPQNFTAAFLRQPIYVDQTGPDDFFNYSFPGANYTLAKDGEDRTYPPVPLGEAPYGYYKNCSVCYNASTAGSNSSRWWGFATVTINIQSIVDGDSSRLKRISDQGYRYALYRPTPTGPFPVAEVGGTVNQASAEFVEVNVPNAVWVLWVEPEDGWNPVWEAGLVAGVVIIALVISCLLGAFLWMHARQGELLQESRATSAILEKTAQELTREKDRLDTMLVRQYDLMNCFSMKSMAKGLTKSQHKLTVDNIEEARTGVNRANNSNTGRDMLEIGQLLGEGAFGKVNKGIWRGTVVAIKTQILPANMPGAAKREKMAVMEAAISSALVHPNIVTTFTYSIRPFAEESEAMISGLEGLIKCEPNSEVKSINKSLSTTGTSRSGDDNSRVHSYQVRLVIEYCDKGTLTDALKAKAFTSREGTIIFTGMVMVALDIARAMVHMHATEVLHTDLKCANIMLTSSATDPRGFVAKVADFGLSTQMKHTETHISSMFQGTPTHMAPEVMLDGRISKACDVYSFGIIMWELLTQQRPFADIHAAHFGHAITKLRKRPTFPIFAPKKYVELAQECWANDAGKRPSFDAIMERLNALLALQPKLNGLLSLPSFEELTPDYTPLKKVSESVLNQSTSSIGIQLIDSGDGVDLSNPGSAFRIGYGKPLPVFVPPVLVALPEGDEGAVTDEALGALPEGEGARKP